MVDSIDSLISGHHAIIQYDFDQAIKVVKVQCTFACDLLVLELDQRFPYHVQDIVHLYMFWANSYTHGCPSRSHLSTFAIQNLSPNLHFCHYNIAHLHHIKFFFQIAITAYPLSVTLPLMLQIFKHKKKPFLEELQ
jgi:hypothetical protein